MPGPPVVASRLALRWVAQRPLGFAKQNIWKIAVTVLGLLRSPTQGKPARHNKPAHRYEPGGQRQARVRLSVTQYRVRARTSNPRVWASSVRMRSVSSRRKLPVTRRVSRLGSQRNTPGR